MKRKSDRKSPRLAAKLKKAVQHLQVDVLGYESKVTRNITAYFKALSAETGIPRERLVLRIFKDRDTIQAGIYHHGRSVKKIPVTALIGLFTDLDAAGFFDLENKVSQKITAFLKGLSDAHQTHVSQIQVCILSSDKRVWVKAYQGTTYIKDILLATLIKHFMG